MSYVEPLMERNFIEYASYVVVDRAIPDLSDGCKPVQRRLLHTLNRLDDGKFHKVANVIGEVMKLHPHGDASIGSALVVLANKDYLIERQGNFGNIITGHGAAAPRYIECRLTELARDTLFNKAVTSFRPSYDGRNKEPVLLPCKLPLILMLGAEGIAVGMATKILPHNFAEILQAQIDVLNDKSVTLYPDFVHGGMVDISEYDDGRGKIRVRAKMESVGDKKIVIRQIPFSTTTESLIASIEAAAQKNKVKISSIDDFTTDTVEIELLLPRGVYAEEVIPQLYAYTDCEVSVSSNIVVISDRQPRQLSVTEILHEITARLRTVIKAELEHERQVLIDRQHWLILERIFIENKIYKKIEKSKTAAAVVQAVRRGMEPFVDELVRPMVDDDIERLLELKIRRISAFDIEKNNRLLTEVEKNLKVCKRRLRQLTKTTIQFLEDLLGKYGSLYPRRSTIQSFQAIDKRAVARQNIKLGYDKTSGFFGSAVKATDLTLTVSEYDFVLAILSDGSFRIMTPQEKVLLPGKVLYCEIFPVDTGKEFVVVYRDKTKIVYGKRVHIHKFIRNKSYQLLKDKAFKLDLLLESTEAEGVVQMTFKPQARSRVKSATYDLSALKATAVTARGVRLATKPVSRLSFSKKK